MYTWIRPLGQMLDEVGIALCLFDPQGQALAWNCTYAGETLDADSRSGREQPLTLHNATEIPLVGMGHLCVWRTTGLNLSLDSYMGLLTQAEASARENAAQLAHKTAQLQAILESMEEGISMFNAAGQLEFFNQRLLELLQMPPGQPPLHSVAQALQALAPILPDDEAGNCVVLCKRPHGQIVEVRSIAVRDGGLLRVLADVTQRQQHQEHTEYLAGHDALTGLFNRRKFTECIKAEIALAQRTHSRFALLYFDLDRFKPINDTHGHAVGDLVLVRVAQVLREVVRECDFIARLGGDEFAVLLRGIEHSPQALALADRLVITLSNPWQEGGLHLQIGASVGLAMYPGHGKNAQELLVAADRAMYLAKSNAHASGSLAPRW